MRTSFPKENDCVLGLRTLSAQIATEKEGHEPKFPLTVKHRHVQVKIYKRTASYQFYRIAYRAEGHRLVRNFKTYGEALKASHASQLSPGQVIDLQLEEHFDSVTE